MAWQSWLDTLVQLEGVTHGAIMGQDGSTWAASPGIAITMSEINSLKITCSAENRDLPSSFLASNQKYFTLRVLDEIVDGKMQGNVISVAKTGQALVFAIHTPADDADASQSQYVSQKLNTAAAYIKSQLIAVNF